MASDLTAGRLEPEKTSVGGLKNAYFINYDADLKSGATITANIISALASPVPVFKFELRGGNSYSEKSATDRATGTTFWEGNATIILKKQDATTQEQMYAIAVGRPQIILEDNNGNYRLLGAEFGCECKPDTSTGASFGEMNGYTINITTSEKTMSDFVSGTLIGAVGGFTPIN